MTTRCFQTRTGANECSPGRVRSAKDRFPLADQIALRILKTRNHPKDIDAAYSHLKNRMHRLQHIRQTLKRGLPSVRQFSSKPQHTSSL